MADRLFDIDGPNQTSSEANDYLKRAAHACEAGDLVLGMYLYLAAYEQAAADPNVAQDVAVTGLHEAWRLACDLRERSMAEYVFEKLEPFLMPDEVNEYASELQELALDRLEQFGFSRDDLEEMAESIASDLFSEDGLPVHIESFLLPTNHLDRADGAYDENMVDEASIADDLRDELPGGVVLPTIPPFNLADMFGAVAPGTTDAVSQQAEGDAATEGEGEQSASAQDGAAQAGNIVPTNPGKPVLSKPRKQEDELPRMPESEGKGEEPLTYRNLVGYDEAIAIMRDFGIGLQHDPAFQNFVNMMNSRHGLSQMPAMDTVLFRSAIIEDAVRFLEATVGEIGLPVLRMTMEEGMQGMPILCVSTQDKKRPRLNHAQNRFEGPSILIIDDLDTWMVPVPPEGMEGISGFVAANMSRGAREAITLIRSAVEDPRIFVFATASTMGEVDPFFYELLEPMTVIDISNPTETERDAIWAEILSHHPSLRDLERSELTRLSAGLSRFDIYMAAREAVEEAYKTGMTHRMFVPVSKQNIYDKLAACFPLDSAEYQAVEDEVVESFRNDLDHLEDLINPA